MKPTQRLRYLSLALFSLLFFLTPVANLFRYDLPAGHFILFGRPWMPRLTDTARVRASAPEGHGGARRLFIDRNDNGHFDPGETPLPGVEAEVTDGSGRTHKVRTGAGGRFTGGVPDTGTPLDAYLISDTNARYILLQLVLPAIAAALLLVWIARRWGRIYCGWLCPHHWVVELLNGLLRRASGRRSLWDRTPMPLHQCDGTHIQPDRRYWPLFFLLALLLALLWALGFLSYLLPPRTLYPGLLQLSLPGEWLLAVGVVTLAVALDFILARHLFCRFGCSVGILQSLFWMSNRKALVVGFDRSRVRECIDCDASCEHACPMRLQPRQIKRKMFTCTQCQQCVQACERVNRPNGQPGLLTMLEGQCALDVSERDFGRRPDVPASCFPGTSKQGR